MKNWICIEYSQHFVYVSYVSKQKYVILRLVWRLILTTSTLVFNYFCKKAAQARTQWQAAERNMHTQRNEKKDMPLLFVKKRARNGNVNLEKHKEIKGNGNWKEQRRKHGKRYTHIFLLHFVIRFFFFVQSGHDFTARSTLNFN